MVTVFLLRHAKSRWDEDGVHDHDRGLAPRGEKAAKRIGRLMRREAWRPDLVLCSTARRARDTWDRVAAELGPDEIPVKMLKGLYLASPGTILSVVRRQPMANRSLLLVGHDPGIHGLAVALAGASATSQLREKYPTGAIARIEFDARTVRDLALGAGRLTHFVTPRSLG